MNIKNYFLIITLIGVIFLVGGVGATINTTLATAACEACGMEIEKEDMSSFLILTSDETEHWACCPICAMVEAIYYNNSEVNGQCFSCGKPIVMNFQEGELSYLDFSGNSEFIRIILGGSCMTNKLTCSTACSGAIRLAYDWASTVPEKTLQESVNIANTKLSSFTIGYKPTKIPLLNYALIGIGISLILIAFIALILQKQRNKEINNKKIQDTAI